MSELVNDNVENIVGKKKNAGYQQFFLFSQRFYDASFSGSFKLVIDYDRVKIHYLYIDNDCMVFTPFSTLFQLYQGDHCTYPCFPGLLFTSTVYNILSKPLAAFPRNQRRNHG